MDNNLSKMTNEKIVAILNERTNSGIPRLERIKKSNPDLYLRLEGKQNKEIADELLKWNSEIVEKFEVTNIIKAKDEIKKYSSIIDSMISAPPEKMENYFSNIKDFRYKYLGKLLFNIFNTYDSKILKRINNIKFLCASYKNDDKNRKYLYEYILRETYYQKAYLIIFSSNIMNFETRYFPLALLLYDISGEEEKNLKFIVELKKYGLTL